MSLLGSFTLIATAQRAPSPQPNQAPRASNAPKTSAPKAQQDVTLTPLAFNSGVTVDPAMTPTAFNPNASKPAKPATPSTSLPPVVHPDEGGVAGAGNDDCAGATPLVIGAPPVNDTTVGMGVDAPPPCAPFAPSGGGVWFRVLGNGNTLTATLCNAVPPTSYDSAITVYCGTCPNLLCVTGNDDSCGLVSSVSWCSAVNVTYYILVFGFAGATGTFGIQVTNGAVCTAGPPCAASCVSCTDTEGEPNCGIPTDTVNGGCNSTPPVFTNISCGQTVCGSCSATTSLRDTDWWLVNVTAAGTALTWTVTADFPVLVGFIAQPCPQTAFLGTPATGAACAATTVTSAPLAVGQYVCFVAPSAFTAIPCPSKYNATLTCQVTGPCVVCTDNEGEPNCGIPTDTVNGGCNSTPPVFTNIACGQTKCGSCSATTSLRDTDWWLFTITSAQVVSWTVTAEFPVLIGYVAQPCPQTAFLGTPATGAACTATNVTQSLAAGTYVAFVAPSVFSAIACPSKYTGTLTCGVLGRCCLLNGSCEVRLSSDCPPAVGQFTAGADCGTASYALSTCTNLLEDISVSGTTATGASGTDDGSTGLTIPIGFPFPYFGTNYTTCEINNNGFLTLSATGAGFFTNGPIPDPGAPNNMIAPAWDDWYSVNTGSVKYQTLAAPQRFIVQWTHEQFFPGSSGDSTFQAILYATGHIEFRYGSPMDTAGSGMTASAGIENADGSAGVGFDPNGLGPNTCRHFAYTAPPNPCGCVGDVDGNHVVNVNDLLAVITHWGACPPPCPPFCIGDIDHNCVVNVNDMLLVITHWGPCP